MRVNSTEFTIEFDRVRGWHPVSDGVESNQARGQNWRGPERGGRGVRMG